MDNSMKYAEGLSKIIQVKTVSNSGEKVFAEFRKVLEELFPALHNNCSHTTIYGDALLYKWKGKSDKKPIVLMAHQDVVPAEDGNWKYPPFSGTIADGKIWGRGAMDCKNTLYVSMQAVEELISEGFVPDNDVYIALSDGEEVFGPGAVKTKDYLKKEGVKPFIVLDEGGVILETAMPNMTKPYAMVGILEKGYADVKFIARSKGGHSSSPPKDTPIARLSKFIVDIETHDYFTKKLVPEAQEMLCKMAGGMKGSLKFILSNLNVFKPLITKVLPKTSDFGNALLSTTIVFTMTGAADAPNVIPQEAYAIANLRFAPHQGSEECFKILKAVADKYDLDMEIITARDASPAVDTKSEGYLYLTECISKCFPDVGIAPYLIMGGTDCRHYQEISDCAMRFTPMKLTNDQIAAMHASNENVNIDTLGDAVNFMKVLITGNK